MSHTQRLAVLIEREERNRKKSWRRRATASAKKRIARNLARRKTDRPMRVYLEKPDGTPGEVFESVRDAAAEFGVRADSIRQQIRTGGYLQNGMRFGVVGQMPYPRPKRKSRPVVRVEDAMEFPGLVAVVGRRATATSFKSTQEALSKAIKKGKRFNGSFYVYAEVFYEIVSKMRGRAGEGHRQPIIVGGDGGAPPERMRGVQASVDHL